MGHPEKLLTRILGGKADANVRFDELRALLRRLGFREQIRGGHHVFRKAGTGIINLQPAGSHAKEYQVRQVRKVLAKADLE